MSKEKNIANELALLRIAVGAIGEDCHCAWWRSAFCGSTANAYLSPIFPRTVMLSVLMGVTAAARRAHDEHIGVGKVFHLFRLPEDFEQAINVAATRIPASKINAVKESLIAAKNFLKTFANGDGSKAVGPISIGKSDELSHPSLWKKAAAMYVNAAECGTQAFPYFVEK